MNKNITYDVVCIGNYTKDTIITPEGVTYVDGGAVNYSAHAAVQLGSKVAVVTRLAQADARVVDAFIASGIDCYPTYTPYSTCMTLDYPTSDPDVRNLSVTHTAGSISPDDVEVAGNMRAAIIGTSLRGEVGLDVLAVLKEKQVLRAIDVQGFVRVLEGGDLKYRPWREMREILALVDILKSDAVEAEYLTGETDIYHAAKAFTQMGPKEIVLTHKNGLLIYAGGEYYSLQFYPRQLDGRSGRGDTCIGSYVAMRLVKNPKEAGVWAAALTSLKMERPGPFKRPMSEVEDLIQAKYNGSI
jgi:sugar/nucleoside kinase (ribokinase family)